MKEIVLSQGKVALVDDEDFERLSHWKWYFKGGYAVRNSRLEDGTSKYERYSITMHETLVKSELGFEVDHKNRNGTDNRKSNLRIATRNNNCWNRVAYKCNKTGLKGVSYHSRDKVFQSRIQVYGKEIHLGYFKTPDEASAVYKAAALKYHGEFANF